MSTCCAVFSQMWVTTIMVFFALFCSYAVRVCPSIAITQMTVHHEVGQNNNSESQSCLNVSLEVSTDPTTPVNISTLPTNISLGNTSDIDGVFDWDETTQGIILSSFFWGYVITHIPAGILADKFGAKYTLGIGTLLSGLFTVLIPVALKYGGGFKTFVMLRCFVGLAQGAAYPALNVMLAQWVPSHNKAKVASIVYAGAPLGTVFTMAMSGPILSYLPTRLGWEMVYYVFGAASLVWCIFWFPLCYDEPLKHPFITKEEALALSTDLSEHKHVKPPSVPWSKMLRSMPVWALVSASSGHGWGFLTMISDLPKYLKSVMKFSIGSNGMIASLPYLGMAVSSMCFPFFTNLVERKGYMSKTHSRKLGNTVASVGPAIFLIVLAHSGCSPDLAVAMLILGVTFMGPALPSIKVNVLDLSPNYSGSVMALANGITGVTGIITPNIVGYLTPNQTAEEWRVVFYIIAGVLIVTNTIYLVFGSAEVQKWNDPDYLRSCKKSEVPKEGVELLPV